MRRKRRRKKQKEDNTRQLAGIQLLYDDLLYVILSFLDVVSAIRFLSTSKRLYHFQDKTVYQHFKKNRENMFSRNTFLKTLNWNVPLTYTLNEQFIEFCIKQGANDWDSGLKNALKCQNTKLVHFYVQKGANDRVSALSYSLLYMPEMVPLFLDGPLNEYQVDGLVRKAIRAGKMELAEVFLTRYPEADINYAMYESMWVGKELVDYFIDRGARNWNGGLIEALTKQDKFYVEFFLEKGANNWNQALVFSVRNFPEYVEFFIQKGANNWSECAEAAVSRNDFGLVKLFVEKGAKISLSTFCYTKNRQILDFLLEKQPIDINYAFCKTYWFEEMADYFVSKGANDWNSALLVALEKDIPWLIIFFIKMGANNWNDALIISITKNIKMARFFVEKGATNLEQAIQEARRLELHRLVEFLQSRIEFRTLQPAVIDL